MTTFFKGGKLSIKRGDSEEWEQLPYEVKSFELIEEPLTISCTITIDPAFIAIERILPAMPSASDAEHDQMRKWFGEMENGTDVAAVEYLETHGYVCGRDWHWRLPTPAHTVSCFEHKVIIFLINEWDFGGIKGDNHTFRCVCGSCKVKP